MNVMLELKTVGIAFQAGRFPEALDKISTLWEKIPNPKTEIANSYLVIEYGVAISLKAGDLKTAEKWAALATSFTAKRQDLGEVEFLVGKVAFERGAIEEAKRNFLIAHAKSDGRIFEGVDRKYIGVIL